MDISNFNLDWLSFTFNQKDCYDLLDAFWNLFPELYAFKEDMVFVRGRQYNNGLCLNDYFTIRYDNANYGKGVNVEIPSHGLEYFFSLFEGIESVRDMFSLLHNRFCTPSRIDVCFDDYKKVYRPHYYYQKFLAKTNKRAKICMVTRMKQVEMVHSSDNIDGESFYCGSRRKKMLRIYDKSIESGGRIDAIRYEIELHSTSARSFFMHIIESGEDEVVLFGDLLLDILKICRRGCDDNHKERWDLLEKWYDFIKSTFSQRFIKIPHYVPDQEAEEIEKHAWRCMHQVNYLIAIHGLDAVIKALKETGLTSNYVRVLQNLAEYNDLPPDFYINRCINFI